MRVKGINVRKRYYLLLPLLFCLYPCTLLFLNAPFSGIVMGMYYWIKPEQGVSCHHLKLKESLPDISNSSPLKGRSIFFHETSCRSHFLKKIVITARQACAVESAAKMNPDYQVYLLYASPGNYVFENTESDRFLNELMQYPNVNVLHVDMDSYVTGSPVEELWKSGKISQSRYAQSHTSDVLRFLTLWKYGGIYLDLDVIVIKSFNSLATDFSGVESHTSVAAGILGFNHTGRGHQYAASCLNDLKHNFRGHEWGWNGPGTITRLLKRLCGLESVDGMINKTCKGFKVYPPKAFYAISWEYWQFFLQPESLEFVKSATNTSYILHVWNKFSGSQQIPIESKGVPYLEFAETYCPNIVKQCDKFF